MKDKTIEELFYDLLLEAILTQIYGKKVLIPCAICDDCTYHGIDGGPSPAACCLHPNAPPYGYIIRWSLTSDGQRHQVSTECPMGLKNAEEERRIKE